MYSQIMSWKNCNVQENNVFLQTKNAEIYFQLWKHFFKYI